jgi:hypothetical protein
MSLNVPQKLIAQAREGKVDDRSFIACVRESLPGAWAIFEKLAADLRGTPSGPAVHAPQSMDDATRGQLLRAFASNAIRGAVERHFGYALAFQNCHKAAAFRPEDVGGEDFLRFTSVEAQILHQRPEFRDC